MANDTTRSVESDMTRSSKGYTLYFLPKYRHRSGEFDVQSVIKDRIKTSRRQEFSRHSLWTDYRKQPGMIPC